MKATIKNEQLKFVNHYGVASIAELKFVAYVASADYAIKLKKKLGKLPYKNFGSDNIPMSYLRKNGVFETDKGRPVYELNEEGRKYLAQGRPDHPYIDRESEEYKIQREEALAKSREKAEAERAKREENRKKREAKAQAKYEKMYGPNLTREEQLAQGFQFLKGKKVVCVRFLTDRENENMFGFYRKPLIFLFDDGTFFIPMRDDEGNDGGSGLLINQKQDIEKVVFSI